MEGDLGIGDPAEAFNFGLESMLRNLAYLGRTIQVTCLSKSHVPRVRDQTGDYITRVIGVPRRIRGVARSSVSPSTLYPKCDDVDHICAA